MCVLSRLSQIGVVGIKRLHLQEITSLDHQHAFILARRVVILLKGRFKHLHLEVVREEHNDLVSEAVSMIEVQVAGYIELTG